jgi:hypothetical protein
MKVAQIMDIATRYYLNQTDELVFVDDNWLLSALANDSPELAPEHILRRPLWGFIADMVTRELYRNMLARVRNGHPVQFLFRCDAPDRRRLLQMRILFRDDQLVEFQTKQRRTEMRPFVTLLARGTARSTDLLRMCGWCNQICLEDKQWVEVEEAIAQLNLFEQALTYSHG